jgi:acyl-CoA thioesterase I
MKYITLLLALTISIFLTSCGSSSDRSSISTEVSSRMRVACVGDSITQGVGVTTPSENSYPVQLSKILAEGSEVGNFGKSGATLIETGDRPYTDTAQFIPSHDFNPNIVVIMLGTNDLKPQNIAEIDRYISDYKTLITGYKNLTSKPIVYICYPPPSYGSFAGITNANILNVLLPKIQSVSIANNVTIIDIYTALSNKKSLFPDTLHPNNEGARIIAETVASSIM